MMTEFGTLRNSYAVQMDMPLRYSGIGCDIVPCHGVHHVGFMITIPLQGEGDWLMREQQLHVSACAVSTIASLPELGTAPTRSTQFTSCSNLFMFWRFSWHPQTRLCAMMNYRMDDLSARIPSMVTDGPFIMFLSFMLRLAL